MRTRPNHVHISMTDPVSNTDFSVSSGALIGPTTAVQSVAEVRKTLLQRELESVQTATSVCEDGITEFVTLGLDIEHDQ